MEVSAALLDFYLSKLNVSVSKPPARAAFSLRPSASPGLVRARPPQGAAKRGDALPAKSVPVLSLLTFARVCRPYRPSSPSTTSAS